MALVLGEPSTARADEPVEEAAPPSAEAAARFSAGLEAFAREDYPTARAAFEEAYRLAPNVRVLANIADCWAREGNPAEAVRVYRRFLAEAGSDVPTAARRLVDRRLLELRALVCDVRVVVTPAGARIRIDGQDAGVAPIADPLPVAAGSHTIEASAEGHVTRSQEVEARAGADLAVSMALVPVASEADRAPPPPVEPPSPRAPPPPHTEGGGRGPLPWIGVAATAALAIAATTTGLIALQQHAEYEDPSTSLARRRELYDSRQTLPLVTDILIDAAIVTGLATAALLLFGGSSEETTDEGGISARVSARLAEGGGLACDLRWAF